MLDAGAGWMRVKVGLPRGLLGHETVLDRSMGILKIAQCQMVDTDDAVFNDAMRILNLVRGSWHGTYNAMLDARRRGVRIEIMKWQLAGFVGTMIRKGIGSGCLT